jgi:hypothetical protein
VGTEAEHSSPYPGLRPFQPQDAEYFYGRDEQVREVVTRLREHRFIAVIGGSGSGKSSLVLAGAIPRLRAFAIRDAGDFWVPVVSTPGTNHSEGDTPLHRLARAFCDQLRSSTEPGPRIERCVEILRTPHGLGELVTSFAQELRSGGGVDLNHPELQINFLFLIDQFEELFHPSNLVERIARDCEHLTNRIIEQFKSPCPQVCVALTMRSEHLNDCPRYENLPDAINGSAYLVKRLDGEQLREAIEQPALRYLRKRVAGERSARREAVSKGLEPPPESQWPDEIPFQQGLIQRLLADSAALLSRPDHADHLPLLQHLLFWTWSAAAARQKQMAVPDELRLEDLWAAVGVPAESSSVEPDESLNTLEACLENRCEAIFTSRSERQQDWETAFRSLAFKEPNTGSYTQQRVNVSSLGYKLGLTPCESDELTDLLLPWLSPHRYLVWDKESATIKVAHETLIRRWKRLRRWTDGEDIQFQVYLRLLEDAGRWEEASRAESLLSTGDALHRYQAAALPAALENPEQMVRFGRLLAIDRDGARLSAHAGSARDFLLLSHTNQVQQARVRELALEREREYREQTAQAKRDADVAMARAAELEADRARIKSHRRWLNSALAILALVLAVSLSEIGLSIKESTLMRAYVDSLEARYSFNPQYNVMSDLQSLLSDTLEATSLFKKGASQSAGPASWWPASLFYAGKLDRLERLTLQAESRTTSSLSMLLRFAAWERPITADAVMGSKGQRCTSSQLNPFPVKAAEAEFHRTKGNDPDHGLIKVTAPSGQILLYEGHIDNTGLCNAHVYLTQSPVTNDSVHVFVSDDLSNLAFEQKDVINYLVVLLDNAAGVQVIPRTTVPKSSEELSRNVMPGFSMVPSTRLPFSTEIRLGLRSVRLFDIEPSPIDEAVASRGTVFPAAAEGTRCRRWATAREAATRRKSAQATAFSLEAEGRERSYCLVVAKREGMQTSSYAATFYGFHSKLLSDTSKMPAPLIEQLIVGTHPPKQFRLNEKEGWLAFENHEGQWRAIPWSVDAWRDLSKDVVDSAVSSD